MKPKALFMVIAIQIAIIVILFYQIENKRSNTLGISVNVIDSKNIHRIPNGELQYFYEPNANSTQEIHEDWLPGVPRYTINNDTLNERFNYQETKGESVFHIITLGDSFTFGQNVSTYQNWTELLEDYLNNKMTCEKVKKYEVINLGVYAYDTQYEVERYRLRGIKYNPDLVIWTFTDFERILEKMTSLIRQNDTQATKNLEREGVYYKNWQIARETMLKEIGKNGVIQFQKGQIDSFDNLYRGSLMYVALDNYPEYLQILKTKAQNRTNSYFFQPDIHYNQKQFFLPDSHFNLLGHQKMMEELVGTLKKNKLLPCN